MAKVLTIYGEVEMDPNSKIAKTITTYMQNSSNRDEKLIKLIDEIEKSKEFPNGFYLYLHKTDAQNVESIVQGGLQLRWGAEHGIDSTLERVFDSKSPYREENLNYISNSVANENIYGDSGIIVALPYDYEDKLHDIIFNGPIYPMVKNDFIVATFEYGKITNINMPQFDKCLKRK